LINNRQGGRRRGRGGQRGQNIGGPPANRQDNRQRGNAAQLLEKYKSMARDAQLSGDRVQTEYYLQFADHYFRVLSESRARFEEQNPRRQRDEFDEDDGEDELAEAGDGESSNEERQPRGDRFSRRPNPQRDDRDDRDENERRPQRQGRAPAEPAHMNGGETIPFDALPPAIGRDEPPAEKADTNEEEPRRRRRSRGPRPAEGEDEVAPAA
jgi:uncharacterized protein DUF4167